jgi:hypothetical protein
MGGTFDVPSGGGGVGWVFKLNILGSDLRMNSQYLTKFTELRIRILTRGRILVLTQILGFITRHTYYQFRRTNYYSIILQ